MSKLGEILDPVADRLYILAAVIGLLYRDIIPWWVAIIIPAARRASSGCLVPFLRTRGYSALPVHYLGKAATAALLYSFPLLSSVTATARWPRCARSSAGRSPSGGWACTGGPGCSTPGRCARLMADRERRAPSLSEPLMAARPDAAGDAAPRACPPQATMGLLDYLTTHAVDEDYAFVSAPQGRSAPPPARDAGRGVAASARSARW